MRHTVVFRGKTYDSDTLTVGDLKKHLGLDPLRGASGPEVLGACLAADGFTEDEVAAIFENDTEVTDMEVRITVTEKSDGRS